jgi:hypothetical protein
VDVLKDVVKEVTHTNDLTSLALCHSALHRLATPHIYSRFDIVWPDSSTHSEPRSGVDALTYGLATLVMAEEVFGEAPHQRRGPRFDRIHTPGKGRASEMAIRRRRGNHYAQFTRKFSLGNGPADWVQEYLITKEGGKMLGTLVALAVARMRALETFVWDMPTGILRDVWLALSSLGDRDDGKECRLEKLWVRFHDNTSVDALGSLAAAHPPSLNLAGMPPALPTADGAHASTSYSDSGFAALDRVESPSFSILPPMKSLSVLEIDELAYLDELAVLVGHSASRLRELRIGIARHVQDKKWVKVWDGDLQQIDRDRPTTSLLTVGEKRLGGVLGVLTSLIYDIRKPQTEVLRRSDTVLEAAPSHSASPQRSTHPPASVAFAFPDPFSPRAATLEKLGTTPEFLTHSLPKSPMKFTAAAIPASVSAPLSPSPNDQAELSSKLSSVVIDERLVETTPLESHADKLLPQQDPSNLCQILQLETLELERVPLSVLVLQKAIDWTRLTTLTILNCQNHEQLWKTLRRDFAPTPKSPIYPSPRRRQSSTPRKTGTRIAQIPDDVPLEYHLQLKKIHTSCVSSSLINFLKETLAPNTLEELYLQNAENTVLTVPIEAIYRGPIRRHRSSLRKLLIDSSDLSYTDAGMPPSNKWRIWMLTREILTFVCGGKMPVLRELGMAIDYRDWHFLLQSLPNMPHLRSLYIPYLADHVHGSGVDPRELALQFVDIVALRPEVELCYMGIANKCFEILENRHFSPRGGRDVDDDDTDASRSDPQFAHPAVAAAADSEEDENPAVAVPTGQNHPLHHHHHQHHLHHAAAAAAEDTDSDVISDEEEAEDDDDDDDDDDDEDSDVITIDEDLDDSSSEISSDSSSTSRLRLREILFYDDKVAIFKARHGRL